MIRFTSKQLSAIADLNAQLVVEEDSMSTRVVIEGGDSAHGICRAEERFIDIDLERPQLIALQVDAMISRFAEARKDQP